MRFFPFTFCNSALLPLVFSFHSRFIGFIASCPWIPVSGMSWCIWDKCLFRSLPRALHIWLSSEEKRNSFRNWELIPLASHFQSCNHGFLNNFCLSLSTIVIVFVFFWLCYFNLILSICIIIIGLNKTIEEKNLAENRTCRKYNKRDMHFSEMSILDSSLSIDSV